MRLIPLLFLSTLALASPRSSYSLIDGKTVAPGDPVARSTVALAHAPTGNAADGLEPYCSGSIVANDLVVTAAHCVKYNQNIHIVFATNALASHPKATPVTEGIVHPHYREGYGKLEPVPADNYDIALLKFEGGLPEGYAPARLLPRDYELAEGDELILAGYGKTLAGNNPDDHIGVLHTGLASVRVPHWGQTELSVDARQGPRNAGGDSGGPAFVRDRASGELLLLGVCNWGRDNQFSVFADVRAHLSKLLTN